MTRSGLTLMVVEDEALIAMDVEFILEKLGHRVAHVASSVEAALDLLAQGATGLDAVLLDANLGGRSARPVAEALTERGIPFVITSGYDRDELARVGFDAPFVRKPYWIPDVEEALRALPLRVED